MSTAKIAITIDQQVLLQLDQWVEQQRLPSRSRAVQQAIQEKLERVSRKALARECGKLDPTFERELADSGLNLDTRQWPEY